MRVCAICGKKLSVFDGKKISGKELICKECIGRLPSLAVSLVSHLTSYDLQGLIRYADEIVPGLRGVFTETSSYGSLHIDEYNNLFAVCGKKHVDKAGKPDESVKDIYRAASLRGISFSIVPDKEQKNRNKVTGSVKLTVFLNEPQMDASTVIREHISCACHRVDDLHVAFDEPNDLVFFRGTFNRMLARIYGEYTRSEEENKEEEWERDNGRNRQEYGRQTWEREEPDSEYAKAKAAFMLEDGYTEKELKAQRNRLLKAFHPDEGDAGTTLYAQNVNRYYEILLDNLRERK